MGQVAICAGVCATLYYCYRCFQKHRAKQRIQALGMPYLSPAEWKPRREFLSVASWNTLRRQYKARPYVDSAVVDWKFRRKCIHDTLLSLDCDLLCLQEAEITTIEEDFGQFLKSHGYDFIHPKLKGSDKKHPHTKPSIFFRSDRLELVWYTGRSRAIIAEFMWKDRKESFFVINCHCTGRAQNRADRFFQVRKWLARLENELEKRSERSEPQNLEQTRIIFLGDFNSHTTELCHQFLVNGHIPDSTPSDVLEDIKDEHLFASHSFGGFQPIYDCLDPFQPWTLCPCPGIRSRVDYIYTRGFQTESLRKPLNDNGRIFTDVLIPTKEYPSDHLPLATELSLV